MFVDKSGDFNLKLVAFGLVQVAHGETCGRSASPYGLHVGCRVGFLRDRVIQAVAHLVLLRRQWDVPVARLTLLQSWSIE